MGTLVAVGKVLCLESSRCCWIVWRSHLPDACESKFSFPFSTSLFFEVFLALLGDSGFRCGTRELGFAIVALSFVWVVAHDLWRVGGFPLEFIWLPYPVFRRKWLERGQLKFCTPSESSKSSLRRSRLFYDVQEFG